MTKYLTVSQLAERWQVHRQTVYQLIWDGKLGHQRFGKAIRVPESDAYAYEQANFHAAAAA